MIFDFEKPLQEGALSGFVMAAEPAIAAGAEKVEIISGKRAKEIIDMNRQGEKPLSLQEDGHAKPTKQHVDLTGGDISRFDKAKKKKKKKKPSSKPADNAAPQKADNKNKHAKE